LRGEIEFLRSEVKPYRDAIKGLKKEDKQSLDKSIAKYSNDFHRHYEFERQLEYSRFIAKRDQEEEQKKQAREEQERQKRLERIAKEEQKMQRQEQPKPPAPTAEAEERATPKIQEQSPKPTNTRGVRP
jgi:hypothetical protein